MKTNFSAFGMFCIGVFVLMMTGCRKQDEWPLNPGTSQTHTQTALRPAEQNGANRFDSHIAQSWYGLMLQLTVVTPGNTPPVAARNFGYTGVAFYESIAGETSQHPSLAGQLSGLSAIPQRVYGNSYSTPLAANAALARMVRLLFENASAANLQRIDSTEAANAQLYAVGNSQEIMNRSRDYGYAVADAVFDWSRTDGGFEAFLNNFPADYVPPAGPDKWVPTPILFQRAMLPYWGNNRVMAAANRPGPVDPPPPVEFSTHPGTLFYQTASEVYNTGLHLSPEQRTIALYWNDEPGSFTPPGHNIAIALQLIRNGNMNLTQSAILLAKLGVTLNDASVVCWRGKYKWILIRPVTYIQRSIAGGWMSLINTPPFPSYASGHATFTGASAGILTAELGDGRPFTDSSKMDAGFQPRSFGSFDAFAREAAMSRLYGGIHYRFENENGYACGQRVAMNVEKLLW